jgi:nicotinamide N-methyltransferase
LLSNILPHIDRKNQVTTTDYPAPVILDAINTNIHKNVPDTFQAKIQIEGHQWGQLDTPFAQANAHRFTRILAADCLWKLGEHETLARSMLHFLSLSPKARVFCIAGFHTGRVQMAPFFEKVVPTSGLEIEAIYEMDENGVRRPWKAKREGVVEDVGERNKWLVVARLKWGSNR